MRDVLDAVQADTRAADQRREKMRADFPEFARIMDELKPHARMRAIWVDGQLVAGKEPPPDPPSWCEVDGGLIECAMNLGRKGK